MSYNYAHPEVIVDTQWLANHLNDPNIRIIETDFAPQQNHIPGAVFWDAFTDLMFPDRRINFDVVSFEQLLARSGIANGHTVITYGDHPGIGAWLFWLLKVFGHQDVRVLDGGRRKWIAEGRSLTAEKPIITPTQYHAQKPDTQLRAFYDDVRESMGKEDSVLVDVRSILEYNGEWFMIKPPEPNERAGHIPNAVHVNCELAVNDDGTFKPVEELQQLYNDEGITNHKIIITYCAIGARSASTWFVLKYLLGYPHVRNYDGSWNEYSQIPDVPIA